MINDVISRNLMRTAARCAVSTVLSAAGAADQRPAARAGELLAGDGRGYQADAVDLAALFGREAPTVLEIGFGMGASLVTMAGNNPQQNF